MRYTEKKHTSRKQQCYLYVIFYQSIDRQAVLLTVMWGQVVWVKRVIANR